MNLQKLWQKGGSAKLCNISAEEDFVKKYTCEHCDLSFENDGVVATHVKYKHEIVPVISTTYCIGFSSSSHSTSSSCALKW